MPDPSDATCCVCNRNEQYDFNRLLECGSCAILVHQGCYGVQKVNTSSNWFCRKCESQVRISKIRCDLCPIKEGAFKRSGGTRGGWAHVLCAVYFPEVHFDDPETMDHILLDELPSDRFGRICVFCERNQRSSQANHGACIQCSWSSCRTYFHVTCARIEGLLSDLPSSMVDTNASLGVTLSDKKCVKNATLDELTGFCCTKHKEKFAESLPNHSQPPVTPCEVTSVSSGFKEVPPPLESGKLSRTASVVHKVARMDREASQQHISEINHAAGFTHLSSSNSDKLLRSTESRDSDDPVNGKTESSASAGTPVSMEECAKLLNCEPTEVQANASIPNRSPKLECNASASMYSTQKYEALSPIEPIHSATSRKAESNDLSPVVPPAKKPRNRQKKSHHKADPKIVECASNHEPSVNHTDKHSSLNNSATRDNLPLTRPAIPLSVRGLCLPLKPGRKSSDSSDLERSGSSTATHNSTSSHSPLATMQDLLEWQWDQAGALLMQQVEGTDVVSLLDCLHQLKSENDSLEAKLLRLKTRQEHLRSVNARLAASLATMESTSAATLPLEDRSSIKSQQSSKTISQDEIISCSPSLASLRSPQVHHMSSTPLPQVSLENAQSNTRLLISAAPSFRSSLQPLTTMQPVEQPSPFLSRSSEPLQTQSSELSTWQLKANHPASLSTSNLPPLLRNTAPVGRTRHTKTFDAQKSSPKSWTSLPAFREPSLQTSTPNDILPTTNLVELSARLSSAIAARQSLNSCSALKANTHTPSAYSTPSMTSTSIHVTSPIDVLCSAITGYTGSSNVTRENLPFTNHFVPESELHDSLCSQVSVSERVSIEIPPGTWSTPVENSRSHSTVLNSGTHAVLPSASTLLDQSPA